MADLGWEEGEEDEYEESEEKPKKGRKGSFEKDWSVTKKRSRGLAKKKEKDLVTPVSNWLTRERYSVTENGRSSGTKPLSIKKVASVKELSGQICQNCGDEIEFTIDGEPFVACNECGKIFQICGDEIEFTVDGEPFVACNECAFPVCRSCYEYERREGNQAYP